MTNVPVEISLAVSLLFVDDDVINEFEFEERVCSNLICMLFFVHGSPKRAHAVGGPLGPGNLALYVPLALEREREREMSILSRGTFLCISKSVGRPEGKTSRYCSCGIPLHPK